MPEHNPRFLHKKFAKTDREPSLNLSPEVEAVVAREVKVASENTVGSHEAKEAVRYKKTKELLPQKPEARIQVYLDYLKESLDSDNPRRAEKLARFKQVLYEKYIVKPNEIPESHWDSIVAQHHRENRQITEVPEETKSDLTKDIIADQVHSLDRWVDYLSSPDAEYPDWFKYYAIRNVLRMNRYDKKKKEFTERTKGTVSPFADLNREALGFVCDALIKTQSGMGLKFGYDIAPDDQRNFRQYAQQENFAKMYAWSTEHFNPIPEALLKKTAGEWRKYPKGSSASELVKDISPYSTGWCIRGEATAARYLSHSDLEVYFSEDKDGNYAIPRLVVVRQENKTQEVRGVAEQENFDQYINEIAEQKLDELPDGREFAKNMKDVKALTAIEQLYDKKTKQWKEVLNRNQLEMLYEINGPIYGFGYDPDPRIKELRDKRDPKADAPVAFDCEPKQIAWGQTEINEDTKAYIGPLFANIFQKLKHLENIYTKFPEGKIARSTIEIGGKTKAELVEEMAGQNIKVGDYAKFMMNSKDFTTAKKPEPADFIKLKVGDLNLQNPTTDQIYQKIQEFGLELCPAEVGPHYRLAYTDQPMDEWVCIGMKQISGSGGNPYVFELRRDDAELWLGSRWAEPARRWNPDFGFVFRLRK